LNQREDIRNYAIQFLKGKMDTDKQMGKMGSDLQNHEHVLDGSRDKDYAQSFRMLIEMIDRTLDDYKSDLQQILFPLFTVLYLTLVRRSFEKGSQSFFAEFKGIFISKHVDYNQ
jgi:transcription initiation factor TFIID subunit 5